MALSDTPPPHAPPWLVAVATGLLALGVLAWDACYVLCILRARRQHSSPFPLPAIALNLAWELVYVTCVIETHLERANFALWLVLDVFLVREILRTETRTRDWSNMAARKNGEAQARFMERWLGAVLLAMTAVAAGANYAFVRWWLAVPHRGFGPGANGSWTVFREITAEQTKTGKWWAGREGFDTTELAFWSAIVSQLGLSAGSLVQLLRRGHSGGASYGIWFCRFIGTFFGLYAVPAVFWFYWPEAQAYVVSWPAPTLCAACLLLDAAYPFCLRSVRRSETVLPGGRVASAGEAVEAAAKRSN